MLKAWIVFSLESNFLLRCILTGCAAETQAYLDRWELCIGQGKYNEISYKLQTNHGPLWRNRYMYAKNWKGQTESGQQSNSKNHGAILWLKCRNNSSSMNTHVPLQCTVTTKSSNNKCENYHRALCIHKSLFAKPFFSSRWNWKKSNTEKSQCQSSSPFTFLTMRKKMYILLCIYVHFFVFSSGLRVVRIGHMIILHQ